MWSDSIVEPLTTASTEDALYAGLLFGAIVGVVMLAVVIVLYVRRRFQSWDDREGSDFTLEKLRQLRDQGELTIAEYEALRRRVLATCKDYQSAPAEQTDNTRDRRG